MPKRIAARVERLRSHSSSASVHAPKADTDMPSRADGGTYGCGMAYIVVSNLANERAGRCIAQRAFRACAVTGLLRRRHLLL